MKIEEVLAIAEEKNSAYRSILRQLNTVTFAKLFSKADEESKTSLIEAVEIGDSDSVRKWMRNSEHKDIEDMSMRELRNLGHKLSIPYYHVTPRSQLQKAILDKYEVIRNSGSGDESRDVESGCIGGEIRQDNKNESNQVS